MVKLKINNHLLPMEECLSYLGITMDSRLTWKIQIDKVGKRAQQRIGIMNKLAGTTWGTDGSILKRLYTGRVQSVLEDGIAAWATIPKTQFVKS
uniref:Reverse transcriptase domain-containing protein n=1 Tax=Arion vulgaris TaxID=1028688 RepID=A0A0B6YRQ6_9EUPU